MNNLTLLIFGVILSFVTIAQTGKLDNKPVFIINNGQWPDEVLFLSRCENYNMWITKTGMVFSIISSDVKKTTDETNPSPRIPLETKSKKNVFVIEFINSNTNPIVETKSKTNTYYNFFIGKNPEKWATNVIAYQEVELKSLYSGIDIYFYTEGKRVRYDFRVSPGANVDNIRFKIKGTNRVTVEQHNALVLQSDVGNLIHGDLRTYQKKNKSKQEIVSSFKHFSDNSFGFDIGNYDHSKTLIIDPLIYSTVIGGADDDEIHGMDLDNNNQAILVGSTLSVGYPVLNAYDQTYDTDDCYDGIISKFNANATGLVFSTFVGGNDDDDAFNDVCVVQNTNEFYVTGSTKSPTYPTTSNSIQSQKLPNDNTTDVVVTKFSQNGSSLLASTYIASQEPYKNTDVGYFIKLTNDNSPILVGLTASYTFPHTGGTSGGDFDVFVMKLNNNLSSYSYSVILGGSSSDYLYTDGLAVDDEGNAYVIGSTYSSNFPTTPYTVFPNNINPGSSDWDAFVFKVNDNGTIGYSTYFGSSANDEGRAIDVNSFGEVVITGNTNGQIPITQDAFDNTHQGFYSDAFITKLSSNASQILYSTYLGGNNGGEEGRSIWFSNYDDIYIAGSTTSDDFPTVAGALDNSFNGGRDIFYTQLKIGSSTLKYSSFFGGFVDDYVCSMVIRGCDKYLSGYTDEGGFFPTTQGAFDQSLNGGYDGFLKKFFYDKDEPVIMTSFPNKTYQCETYLDDYTINFIAVDNCDNNLTYTQNPPANTHLVVGDEVLVTVKATDDAGNYSITSFWIFVVDTIPPVISCPEDTTLYIAPNETFYTVQGTFLDASKSDDCGSVIAKNSFNQQTTLNNAQLPVGQHQITWTATDEEGNQAQCSFIVTVQYAANINYVNDVNSLIISNPNYELVNILNTPKDFEVIIYNNLGQIVLKEHSKNLIDISNLPSGNYLLAVINLENGEVRKNKLIKI